MGNQIGSYTDQQALDLVAELSEKLQHTGELNLIRAMRKKGLNPELVRFAVEQAKLRHRASKKFGEQANSMLFTEAGLEQATRKPVANWHASLLVQAKIETVTDLGCGIGADALAFAENGLEVIAVDNHEPALIFAKHNLRDYSKASFLLQNAEESTIRTQAVYLDPARRDQATKSAGPVRLGPKDFSPSLDFSFDLARKLPTLIKLSPGFPHELIPDDLEANWVSNDGDLVEVLLKGKALGTPGLKKAVMIGSVINEFVGKGVSGKVGPIGAYVFEPDAALVRSHLIGDFANQNGLTLLAPGIAYLSSSKDLASPWLKRYRVLQVLPLKEKEIRAYCTKNQIGTLEIKKRGVDITPEELRPKLRLKGTGVATLILTKLGDARQAIVCESIR